MERLTQELRHAARRLLRAPSFTVATVITLALAIGATASIFAVVQRVVLNPLPYPDSGRLIQLVHAGGIGMGADLYAHYAGRARTLESVAIWDDTEVTLTGDREPERLRIARVTPSLASVLRVVPIHGRWVRETEGVTDAQTAVLSYGLWMRRYGGDTAVIGRSITVNGVPMEVIGVMPAGFAYPDPDIGIWINDERLRRLAGLGFITHTGVARLREGVTIDDARTELTRLIADLPNAYPESPRVANLASTLKVATPISLKEATIGNVARALWILLASVSLVLLVACANVANLFLVRSEARQAEVAVRLALGAARRGIARYFLTESLILSLAGAGIGLGLAWAAVQFLVAAGPATLPRLHEIRLDGYAVTFTIAVSIAAGLAFGTIPLLRQAPRPALLRDAGRGTTGGAGRFGTRQLLMGAQIAFALVLLAAAGLMVRSFQNLRSIDAGFDPTSTLTFRLGLPASQYPDHDRVVRAHRAITERLSTLPGVLAASAANCLPLENERCVSSPLRVDGRPLPEGASAPGVWLHGVTDGYFEAIGMRVQRGRGIDRDDVERRRLVVVVNQALVDAYFPGQDPIGQRVTSGSDDVWGTIVGVASNTPTAALNESSRAPKLYMPMSVTGPDGLGGPNPANVSYIVRSATPPLGLLQSVRRAIGSVDPDLAVAQPRTLQDIFDRASAQMAFTMVLLAIAAVVALTLGVVGIYGAMSYIVSQRAGEIGVRVALGAKPSNVAGMIVWQGGIVAVVGIGIGLGVALGTSRFIESLLFDVSPSDPAIFAAIVALLFGISLLACWLPARRASRLNPVDALRAN
ncbi:MAG TPA: ABC transporter permease [Vicinamibacterales bacterium]|nr:ABC transporter permease [Vicinamibacterales bacterium]